MEEITINKPVIVVTEIEPSVDLSDLSAEERIARKGALREENLRADKLCEKYKKGDVFNFSLEKSGNAYRIIMEGVRVGVFSLGDDGNTKHFSFIIINKNLRHKGFGRQLYIKLNEYFRKMDGSVLMTDKMKTNGDVDGLWESLFRDRLVEEVPNASADGHKVYKFKK